MNDPWTAVWSITPDLSVSYVSPGAARLLAGVLPEKLKGRSLPSILPAIVCERLRRIVDKVDQSSEPVHGRAFWNGRRIRSQYIGLRDGDGSLSEIVGISRPSPLYFDDNTAESALDEAEYADLGPLSHLTVRELEVLAYLGQGLSRVQIARELHRSEKTVKRFREQLGAKMAMGDRCRISQAARDAGLTPGHASLPRIDWRPML